jgi:hypothetical protein
MTGPQQVKAEWAYNSNLPGVIKFTATVLLVVGSVVLLVRSVSKVMRQTRSILQSRKFLGGVLLFAVILVGFLPANAAGEIPTPSKPEASARRTSP